MDDTKKQIEFIKMLAERLDANQCPTRIKADVVRLRRELNELAKMQTWEYRHQHLKKPRE